MQTSIADDVSRAQRSTRVVRGRPGTPVGSGKPGPRISGAALTRCTACGERSGCSGVIAELAAERVRLLHQRRPGENLEDLPEVLLVLHVLGRLALDDDDRADEL